MAKIRIGTATFKQVNLKKERVKYPYCDSKGKLLEIRTIKKGERAYVYQDTGKRYEGDVLALVNDKPVGKLTKTKEIYKHEVVEKLEHMDLMVELYYLMEASNNEALKLYKNLVKQDKALSFIYSNGNGYKAYQTYLVPFGNERFIMFCGYGKLSEQIKKKSRDIEIVVVDKEVERATAEMVMA